MRFSDAGGSLTSDQTGQTGSLRGAFIDRATRAIEGLSRQLDDAALQSAVAEPTDTEVLLAALRSVPPPLNVDDPLAAARERGLMSSRALLHRHGEPWTVQAVADHLGISRQAVSKRVKASRLLAVDTGRHGLAYPPWQFVRGGVLPGLEDVLADLGDCDGWMALQFFLGQNLFLDGQTPLDRLQAGDEATARLAAQRHAEQGGA